MNDIPAERRPLCVGAVTFEADPADKSISVAGIWIRFMTRLAIEIGMTLPFPKRCPSTEAPIKGTAEPAIAKACKDAVIKSRRKR